MLGNFLRLKMDEYESAGFWFQQDRATARYSRAILQEMILCRLISLRGDVAWPSRSPDLSPCNFFFLCRICRNCTWYSGESNGKLQRTTPYISLIKTISCFAFIMFIILIILFKNYMVLRVIRNKLCVKHKKQQYRIELLKLLQVFTVMFLTFRSINNKNTLAFELYIIPKCIKKSKPYVRRYTKSLPLCTLYTFITDITILYLW